MTHYMLAVALAMSATASAAAQETGPQATSRPTKSSARYETKNHAYGERDIWATLEDELDGLVGKPQNAAFDRLGQADLRKTIDTTIVYSWVNNEYNFDGKLLMCSVSIFVVRGIIDDTYFDGNAGACVHYATTLDPSFPGLPF